MSHANITVSKRLRSADFINKFSKFNTKTQANSHKIQNESRCMQFTKSSTSTRASTQAKLKKKTHKNRIKSCVYRASSFIKSKLSVLFLGMSKANVKFDLKSRPFCALHAKKNYNIRMWFINGLCFLSLKKKMPIKMKITNNGPKNTFYVVIHEI